MPYSTNTEVLNFVINKSDLPSSHGKILLTVLHNTTMKQDYYQNCGLKALLCRLEEVKAHILSRKQQLNIPTFRRIWTANHSGSYIDLPSSSGKILLTMLHNNTTMKQHHYRNCGLKALLCIVEEAKTQYILSRKQQLHISMFRLNLGMKGEELTEQETALYDRQIRVWGVDAQRRLSKSQIFVSGLTGTAIEFCKNIVLAGVGSVTLNDDRAVTEEALSANFLVPLDDIEFTGKSVAEICSDSLKNFNPMVCVAVEKGGLSSFSVDFFGKFDVVVVSSCSLATKRMVNEKCRKLSKHVAFYAVDCRDSCGEIFVDLQNYAYSKKQLDATTECKLQYPSFEESIDIPWRSLPRRVSKLYFALRVIERFEDVESRCHAGTSTADLPDVLKLRNELCQAHSVNESQIPDSLIERLVGGASEFPPVCAIIGGILGQEVIKAISGKGDPIKNFFFYDAVDGKGVIEDVSNS